MGRSLMNNDSAVRHAEQKAVLIVSAHRHLRQHYCSVLAPLGVRLITTADAFEALDALRAETVHAVLSDYYLPGMDALGLFVFMRELHLGLPFVLCSTDLRGMAKADAERLGIFRIVRKPTLVREIQRSLQLALEERELQMLKFYC